MANPLDRFYDTRGFFGANQLVASQPIAADQAPGEVPPLEFTPEQQVLLDLSTLHLTEKFDRLLKLAGSEAEQVSRNVQDGFYFINQLPQGRQHVGFVRAGCQNCQMSEELTGFIIDNVRVIPSPVNGKNGGK